MIEATADTVPASQQPLNKALKTTIRATLLTQKKQSVANKWFTTFQKKIEKNVRYAAGFAPAKTTSTAHRRQRRRRPRPADAALGRRTGSGVGLLGVVVLAGCGGSSGSGSDVPVGDVAVVDGQTSRSPISQTTMNIAKLSMKTSYPEPGTDDWVSLRTRALEALAHDAELRAWARNLGVTVKPSAVDAAVKQTLVERVPRQDGGQRRPGQGRRGVQEHGHDAGAAAAPHRDEAAGRRPRPTRSAARPSVTDAQIQAQYDKDKATLYVAAGAPQGAPHPGQDEGARRPALLAALVLGRELRRARQEVLDGQHARPTAASSAWSIAPSLVKPFADVAFTLARGRRLEAGRRRSSAGT